MKFKMWKLPAATPAQIDALCRESGLNRLACAVLAARGMSDANSAAAFLRDLTRLEDPFKLKDMDKAVSRILSAIEDGERIAVYGDYDCDGVTSTAMLVSYLQSVGGNVIYYVPDRAREGYGLNKPAIKILKDQKTGLIVTVDNGVSAHEEVEYAASFGIDVVITDHHTPRETLPAAVAVVDPKRADCASEFKELAGVGVAFKLVCALENALPEELLEYYSDLVALGTVADVVPLAGENRTIVKHGIQLLRENERPGIKALLEVAGLDSEKLTCESMAFGLAPRINAAGRMGPADDAVEMLLTDDADAARQAADLVNSRNIERKKAEDIILMEADKQLAQNPDILDQRIIVLCGDAWHHGVVGIVAAKLVERYGKPCILFSVQDGSARGSGRSIEGFSLIEAISECRSRLERFGGHTLAAGMTLPAVEVQAFTSELLDYARKVYTDMPVAYNKIDAVLTADMFELVEFGAVSALEPFGAGNETPLYLMEDLALEGVYPVGEGRHIRLRLKPKKGNPFYAVYFNVSEKDFPYRAGAVLDIVAHISVSEYNGNTQLSVKLRDLRPGGSEKIDQERFLCETRAYDRHRRREYRDAGDAENILPKRDDVAVVYRHLKRHGGYTYGETALCYELCAGGENNAGRVRVALDILEELGLLARGPNGITIPPESQRVNLEDSEILKGLRSKAVTAV